MPDANPSYIAAVEIELNQKSYPTWKAIWNELLRHYAAVWYYVGEDISRRIEALPERRPSL